jgi:hypothetical protein
VIGGAVAKPDPAIGKIAIAVVPASAARSLREPQSFRSWNSEQRGLMTWSAPGGAMSGNPSSRKRVVSHVRPVRSRLPRAQGRTRGYRRLPRRY